MTQIGLGFAKAADGVPLRSKARAQALEMREDEPHPVRSLAAASYFRQCLFVGTFLRVNETSQVVAIHVLVLHLDSG